MPPQGMPPPGMPPPGYGGGGYGAPPMGYGGGGGGNRRAGDWDCTCGAHNFASRHECFKCNAPKGPGGCV